jgi:hypothetical protein
MHRENDAITYTSFNKYGIAQRLRPCNLHSPLSLRINAIVDDHVAVVFAKLSNLGGGGGGGGCIIHIFVFYPTDFF